jgi:serine/threonine protein kinase
VSCLDENLVVDLLRGRAVGKPLADAEQHLAECDFCTQLFADAAGALPFGEPDVSASDPDGAAGDLPAMTTLRPLAGDRAGPILDDHGSLAPGTPLNDTYRVIRYIGRGGMGEVYEVAHARLSGRYAAKVLTSQIAATDEIVSRFRREAQITSALRHPNIVQVIDFNWTSQGRPFLVMEYMEGVHLGRIIQAEAPLSLARVLQIVGPIVSALVAVHRSGVIHRDLKPQNIMLLPAPDGTGEVVKLLDFGLSKRTGLNASESLLVSRERMLLGTPLYMAPEQARGDSENVGAAADQFALAAIIYEMLTRRAAFAGNCLETVLYRIAHVEPESMIDLAAEVPVAVDSVVRRALSKDVPARFSSIASFFNALRDAAEAPELAGHDSKSTAIGPQLSATTKDLTGEAVAASWQRPFSKGKRAAGIGLALGAGLVLFMFLLAGVRLQHPPPVPLHAPEPAQRARVVSGPPARSPELPPTEDIHLPPAPPQVPSEPKPKARVQGAQSKFRPVKGPKRGPGEDATTPQAVPPVLPHTVPPVPEPIPAPSAPPPIEADKPETPAPHRPVSGFTKL